MTDPLHSRHPHKRVNLGEYENEEDILDAIEQSRRITRLIISAVQKGSKFEVSQILEHYGLAMTSRLHFKVVNIVMEQWFSLMGIDDEEQIWNILRKNKYAMNRLRQIRPKGMMVLSDMLTEWELPIGALQSKIIRRIQDFVDNCAKEQPEPIEENDECNDDSNNNNNNTYSADSKKKESNNEETQIETDVQSASKNTSAVTDDSKQQTTENK